MCLAERGRQAGFEHPLPSFSFARIRNVAMEKKEGAQDEVARSRAVI